MILQSELSTMSVRDLKKDLAKREAALDATISDLEAMPFSGTAEQNRQAAELTISMNDLQSTVEAMRLRLLELDPPTPRPDSIVVRT